MFVVLDHTIVLQDVKLQYVINKLYNYIAEDASFVDQLISTSPFSSPTQQQNNNTNTKRNIANNIVYTIHHNLQRGAIHNIFPRIFTNTLLLYEISEFVCWLEICAYLAALGNDVFNSKKPTIIVRPLDLNFASNETEIPRPINTITLALTDLFILRNLQHFVIVNIQEYYIKAKISDRYYLALFMESYLDSIVPSKDIKIDPTSTSASKELLARFELIFVIFTALKTLGDLARLQRAQQVCFQHGLLSAISKTLSPQNPSNKRKPTLKLLLPALNIALYLAINQQNISKRLLFSENAIRAFNMCISAYGNIPTSAMSKEENENQVNIFVGSLFILSNAGNWIDDKTMDTKDNQKKEHMKRIWNDIPAITFIQEIFPLVTEYTSPATMRQVFEKFIKLFETTLNNKLTTSPTQITNKQTQSISTREQISDIKLKNRYYLISEIFKAFLILGTAPYEMLKVESFLAEKPYFPTIIGAMNFYYSVNISYPFRSKHIDTYLSNYKHKASLVIDNSLRLGEVSKHHNIAFNFSAIYSTALDKLVSEEQETFMIFDNTQSLLSSSYYPPTKQQQQLGDTILLKVLGQINKEQILYYLMAKLNNSATLSEIKALTDIDLDDKAYHIINEYDQTEHHILPQTPESEWVTYSGLANKLDSRTLLENPGTLSDGYNRKNTFSDTIVSLNLLDIPNGYTYNNNILYKNNNDIIPTYPFFYNTEEILDTDINFLTCNEPSYIKITSTYQTQSITFTTNEPFYICNMKDVNRHGVLAAVEYTITEAGEIGSYIIGISTNVSQDAIHVYNSGEISGLGVIPGSTESSIGYDPTTGNLLYYNKKLKRMISKPYGWPLSTSDRIVFYLARKSEGGPVRLLLCINGVFLPPVDNKIFEITNLKHNAHEKYFYPIVNLSSPGIKIKASVMTSRWSTNRDSSRKLTLATLNPLAHFFFLAFQKTTVCPHFHANRFKLKSILDEWYTSYGKTMLVKLMSEHPQKETVTYKTLNKLYELLNIATMECLNAECPAKTQYYDFFKSFVA